ncbi:MAG: hypothetical protein V2A79_07430 [Planctomycetota bacterium]
MTRSRTRWRWVKWLVPGWVLLQVGACTTDALVQSLENEVVLSASSFAFTAAQTVFMNLLDV